MHAQDEPMPAGRTGKEQGSLAGIAAGPPEKGPRVPIDYAVLAENLLTVGYPVRLQLLQLLRVPHAVAEISLPPHRVHRGANPQRAVARQTVQTHLDKLVQADLVRAEQVEQRGRTVTRYAVNPRKLYGLTEELRRLSTFYAGSSAPADATGTLGAEAQVEAGSGPRMVLVHGAHEGKTFPLRAAGQEAREWRIGRNRGLAISLDYDPFISAVNAVVSEDAGDFSIRDLDDSKNGTSVNWRLLRPGEARTLRSGDVIRVGRSMLVFVRE